MNVGSVVVLLIVAVLVVLAIRYEVRSHSDGHCEGCSNGSCGGADTVDACPMAQQAVADVEARLGKLDD